MEPLSSTTPTKAPLVPAPSERINQQNVVSPASIQAEQLHFQQKQSDVQAKIAFINSLTRSNIQVPMPQSPSSSAAMQRAVLGREEAESTLSRVMSQLADSQARERRISERLESLLEELQAAKERQAHERLIFEKEVRKARKEAFRASSTLLKTQEDFKLSKEEIKVLKEEVKVEKEAKDRAKQEAFERAYALAGLTEELEFLKGKLRSLEADSQSDVLEARARDMFRENAERTVVAEKDPSFLTPTSRPPKRSVNDTGGIEQACSGDGGYQTDETPSKKVRLSRRASNKENRDPNKLDSECELIESLNADIKWERRQRVKAEDMVQFLKMECQFKRCSCRLAERLGIEYIHDGEWYQKYREQHLQSGVEGAITQENKGGSRQQSASETGNAKTTEANPSTFAQPPTDTFIRPLTSVLNQGGSDSGRDKETVEEPLITFSPTTGTFRAIPSPQRDCKSRPHEDPFAPNSSELAPHSSIQRDSHGHLDECGQHQGNQLAKVTLNSYSQLSTEPSPADTCDNRLNAENCGLSPKSDKCPENEDDTAAKSIPLLPEDGSAKNAFATIPGTPISREEALAQIRARRDKARNMLKRSASTGEVMSRPRAIGMPPLRAERHGSW